MKTFLVASCIFSICLVHFCHSAPVDPEDEVELVPAENTNTENEEDGFIPIFVIRQNEGSPFFGNFPFGQGFPFFNDEAVDKIGEEEEFIPEIPLMTSFFGDEDQPGDDETSFCGFICSIMKQFDDRLKSIQDQIKNIHQIEGHDGEDQPNINNTTYVEKVLPDGSVVKINRTIISDKSEDGNSFFFHSTSYHNVDAPEEESNDKEDEEEIELEYPDPDFEEFPQAKPDQEIPFLDEAINEVPEENARRKRSDPFAQQQVVLRHPNQIRRIQPSWKPIGDDTRVNDILTNNGKRGSLVRIEPDSEFIRRNPATGEVEPHENANPWAQESI